eukprot:UN25148
MLFDYLIAFVAQKAEKYNCLKMEKTTKILNNFELSKFW